MNYSVAEFRKNIRVALDAVDKGEEVIITRHDKAYLIVHSATFGKKTYIANGVDPVQRVDLAKKNTSLPDGKMTIAIDGTPVPRKAFKKLTTDKVSSPVRPDIKYCPHGYAAGFCKKADCNRKYAK